MRLQGKGRNFFSEEKKQKTFYAVGPAATLPPSSPNPHHKSLFASFSSEKEGSYSLVLLLLACIVAPSANAAQALCAQPPGLPDPAAPLAGMVALPAGRFSMGAAPVREEEGPAHVVHVATFAIDRTDVTNAQYARFVQATGYRTLAERGLDAARFPGLSAADRRPASLVFIGAAAGADLHNPAAWWRIVPGADWRHPEGPGSSIAGRDALPVVHVAYEDAQSYATWLGHALPTEAEWEYAARGGLVAARYIWGDVQKPGARPMANTWQGSFPDADHGDDGYRARPSPVGCFPANGFGLYDMAGNVWQWTSDIYTQPEGAAAASLPQHVIKGGSFLCSDSYCFRYRPAARSDGPNDSGASHIGFRTVLRAR